MPAVILVSPLLNYFMNEKEEWKHEVKMADFDNETNGKLGHFYQIFYQK